MKRKSMARVLTFLLAFCLAAQLMPAPAVAAEGDTITYTFGSAKTTFADVKFDDVTTGKWEFNEQESHPRWGADGMKSTGWANMKATYCQPIIQSGRNYLAFDLMVETAGYYNATIDINYSESFDISINGKKAAETTANQTTNSLGTVYLYKGINTVQIKYNGTAGGFVSLYNVKITPASEDEINKTFSLDFTADDVVTTYDGMTIARQGIRFFPFFTSSVVVNHTYTGFTKTGNTSAALGFNRAAGNFAGFDFNVSSAGVYDIVVVTEDNPNHSLTADVIINGTGAGQGTTLSGTAVGRIDAAPNRVRAYLKNDNDSANAVNQRAAHLISEVTLNAGMNLVHFKSVSGNDNNGEWNLYFKEAISLVNPEAVTTTEGEKLEFAALNEQKTVTVTAPERGIYYVYLNAKKQSGGFGGYASVGGIKQYVDFSKNYYDTETVDTIVTRPIGPVWLNAGNNTLTLQEIATASSTLDIDSIEVHEIKQNLWTMDKASQNYADVKMTTHGWEVDEEYTSKIVYDSMMKGSYGGAIAYPNSAREANWTDLNLMNGDVGFKFNVPVAGTYKIDAVFGRRNANTHDPIVSIVGTNLKTKVVQYNAGTQITDAEAEIGVVTLEAGENTIIFENSGEYNTEEKDDKYLYIKNLTFTPYTGATVKDVTVTADKTELTVDDTATATATVNMSDNTTDPEGTTVTWSSSAAGVATVDATSGVITAVGAGEAVITATANVMGVNYTGSVTVKVSAKAEEIPPIFGNTYAYIRETVDGEKTNYTLVLVAAIDSLNYKEVGFGISDGTLDEKGAEAGTDKVYNSVVVGETTVTAEDFGLENGYIFVREIPVASANVAKSIDFWAYAIANDEAGTKTEGGKRTIDALVKAE